MRRLKIDPAVLRRFPQYMTGRLAPCRRGVLETAAWDLARRLRRISPACSPEIDLLGNAS